MSRAGHFSRLSIAVVAVTVFFGTTAVYAAAFGGPPANGVPRVAASGPPFPSPTPTTPMPSPTPTPFPSPSPSQACTAPPDFTPTGGPSSTQDAIENVGGRIMDIVEDNQGNIIYPGFTGLIPDPDHQAMVVCWRRGDPLPQSIANIIANPGVALSLSRKDSTYSRTDLESPADRLIGDLNLDAQIAANLHTMVVPEEGTGLIARVDPKDPSTFNQAAAQATLTTAAGGIPVTVEIGIPNELTVRKADIPPFKGGARLDSGGTSCSSGFGLLVNKVEILLTAAHCFGMNAPVTNGGNAVGPVVKRFSGKPPPNSGPDSEAIAIGGGNKASGLVYIGGVGPPTEGTIRVTRVGVNLVNQEVNTSGSFSGENDQLKVKRTNVRERVNDRGNIIIVAPVTQADATVVNPGETDPIAVAAGDSGGPVIRREIGDPVEGKGTIIAGGKKRFNCNTFDARICYTQVTYNSLRLLLRNPPFYGGALSTN
jgi:hypothetical protein